MNGKSMAVVAAVLGVLSLEAAWYENPGTMKLVPLATNSAKVEDPHFMNKSEDDSLLLVNMNAGGDNDGALLLSIPELADSENATPTLRKPLKNPSAGFGANWKGGAIANGLALLGCSEGTASCAFSTEGTVWLKGANVRKVTLDPAADGLDFGTGATFLYSNVAGAGGLVRRTVDSQGTLSGAVTKATTPSRVLNVSVHSVNGRELVYYGNGADGTSDGALYVMDVTAADPAEWTETALATVLPGPITNAKLSNEDTDAPILYALTDNGYLGIYQLSADGLSVATTIQVIEPAALKALAGGDANSAVRFRNFEVTKDGTTAFLINRTDEHNVSLAVIASNPYVETLGVTKKGIDTGYTPGPDTAIWADFAFMGNDPVEQYFICEAGYNNTNGHAFFRPYINGNQTMAKGTRCYAFALNRSGFTTTGVPVVPGERHQITLDAYSNRVTFVSGSTVKTWNLTCAKAAHPAYRSLKLFCESGYNNNYAEIRLYGLKVYEKGVLVRNYVPARRGSTIGFYETMEGNFICDCLGNASYTGVGALTEVAEDKAADTNYIESDGSAAVSTDYYANGKTSWEIDFQLPVEATDGPVICGSYGGTFSTILYYKTNKDFATCIRDGGWAEKWIGKSDLKRRTFKIDGLSRRYIMLTEGVRSDWGGLDTEAVYTKTSNRPFMIFANGTNVYGNAAQRAKVRVFGLKIWEDGVLKRDYRPVILDGRIGFRELVEKKFVTSQGLTAGAGVPAVSRWGEPCIASSGLSAMGTGFFPTDKSKIEVDWALDVGNNKQVRVYGNDWAGDRRKMSVYVNGSGYIAFGYGDKTWRGPATGAITNSVRYTTVEDMKNRKFSFISSGSITNWTYTPSEIDIKTNFCLTALGQVSLFGTCNGKDATNPSVVNCAKVRIFGAKFYEDDVLVRDYVPATRHGVAGLRDRVSGAFFTCEGLSAIGDVEEMEGADDAYAEANGGTYQYVTTPHLANGSTRYEVDFQLTAVKNGTVLFGSYDCDFSGILFLSGGNFNVGMGDGSWGDVSLGGIAAQDLDRHTLVMDGPSRRYAFLKDDGSVVKSGSLKSAWTKTATCPTILFGSSNSKYKNGNGTQIPSARIYGARIYTSGELKHDYVPRIVDGVVGFKDLVTGRFVAGENLAGGGGILEEKGDPFLATGDRQDHTMDTGITITSNSCIDVDFAFMVHDNNPQQFIWETGTIVSRVYTGGSKTNDAVYSWACYSGSSANYTSSETYLQAGVRRHFIVDSYNNRAMLETAGYTNYTGAITKPREGTSSTIRLFSNSGRNSNFANIRLYGFKVYEKGVLVHDLVPYQMGDEGALRDRLTGNVITRRDSTYKLTLTCGGTLGEENVADFAGDDAYLDLDGSAPLVLGYHANPATRLEVDFQAQPPYVDSMLISPWESGSQPDTAMWVNGSGLFQFITGANKFTATTKYADGQRYVAVMDAPNDRVSLRPLGGTALEYTPGTTYSGTAAWPLTLGGSVKNAAGTSFEAKFTCKLRCYGVKIYESDTLVHDFVPYRTAEGVSGLMDVAGNLGFRTATSASVGGKPYTGEVTVYTVQPQDATLCFNESGELVANVTGADHYEWTFNGVTICGAEGNALPIVWHRHKKAQGYTDVYTVTPIFVVNGETIRGETKSATVTSVPSGLLLIIK